MIFRASGIFATLFLFSACSSDDARLRDLYDVNTGPEEFAVLPSKPLTIPNSLENLYLPQSNRFHFEVGNPRFDLIILLSICGPPLSYHSVSIFAPFSWAFASVNL